MALPRRDAGSPPKPKPKGKVKPKPQPVRTPPRKAADPTPERRDAPNRVTPRGAPRPRAVSRGSAERLGRPSEPVKQIGPRGGRKGAPIKTRTFADADEANAYIERLEDKRDARKAGFKVADEAAKAHTRVLGTPERKEKFRGRVKQIRKQADRDFERERELIKQTAPDERGPLRGVHRDESRDRALKEAKDVRDEKKALAPTDARAEIGKDRAKNDPVRKRARRKYRKVVRREVIADNKLKKAEDEQQLADGGVPEGSRAERGLEAGEAKARAEHERKVIREAREKRRKGGVDRWIKNAADEVKDAAASLPDDVAGLAKGAYSIASSPPSAKIIEGKPDKRIEETRKAIEEGTVTGAVLEGDFKEAAGRLKERPLSGLSELAIGAGVAAKGVRATKAVGSAPARTAPGVKGKVRAARQEAKERGAERRARPTLRAEQNPTPRPDTKAGRAKTRAAIRKKVAEEKAAARTRAQGAPSQAAHDRPTEGTVRVTRSYSPNAAVRGAQKAKDTVQTARGVDPHVASGRKSRRIRKKDFDKEVRNLQASGIGREEAVVETVRKALKGVPKGPTAEGLVQLMTIGAVRLEHLERDLQAVRKTIADNDSPHRESNLAVLDELIDDAAGGEGLSRHPVVRSAARALAAESRRGDQSQHRTGYAEEEALEFIRLAQGPLLRGDIREVEGRKDVGGGGGRPPTPPGGGGDLPPRGKGARSIMDDVVAARNAETEQPRVTVGERGGGVNPGDAPKSKGTVRKANDTEESLRRRYGDYLDGTKPMPDDDPAAVKAIENARARLAVIEGERERTGDRPERTATRKRIAEIDRELQVQAELRGPMQDAIEIEEGISNASLTLKGAKSERARATAQKQLEVFTKMYRQLAESSPSVAKRLELRRERAQLAKALPQMAPGRNVAAHEATIGGDTREDIIGDDDPIGAQQQMGKMPAGQRADEVSPRKVIAARDKQIEDAIRKDAAGTPAPATPSGSKGRVRPRGGTATASTEPRPRGAGREPGAAKTGSARYEDTRTGEPIHDLEQLLGYHTSDPGFVRGTKPTHGDDRTPGAPTAGHGYTLEDLLGPLGEGRLENSALERERRTTLRLLNEMVLRRHGRTDKDGALMRFQSREEALKQTPDGWRPLEHRAERGDQGGSKEWIVLPKFIADRYEAQLQAPGRVEAGGRWASRIAVRAMLPFSALWHAGNSIDLTTRLALSLDAKDLQQSGQIAAALERQLEQLSPELRGHVMDSLVGHFGSRQTVRDPRFSGVIEGRKRRQGAERPSAAVVSDAAGDFVKRFNPVGKAADFMFDKASEMEQIAVAGRLRKSGKRAPNAVGAIAKQYARDLGYAVDDATEIAKALAGEMKADPAKLADFQDRVLQVTGDFATRSPGERKLMAGVDVFWTWLRESHRFVLKTLPEKHPKRTALLFMVASMTAEERLRAGSNAYFSEEEIDAIRKELPEIPERLDGFLLGAVGEDSVIPTVPFTSFGEVAGNLDEPARIAGRFGSLALRPVAAAMGSYRTPQERALKRLPEDAPLGLGEGEPEDLDHHGDSKTRTANMVAELAVPGLRQVRRVREKGGIPKADSTAINPKGDKDGTIASGVETVLNPFKAQKRQKTSEPEATLPPVGSSYTITFTDPATGEKVTRRLLRKR